MSIFKVSVTSVNGESLLHEEFAHSNKHAERIASNWNHLDVKIHKTLFRVANSKQGWIDFLNNQKMGSMKF